MAYSPPTVAMFKARFPEFASLEEARIAIFLDEAQAEVGDTWIEADRSIAVLCLAAHLLTAQGISSNSPGGGGVATAGAIKRRKVGDVEVEYETSGATPATGSSVATAGTTHYGRRYLELKRRSFPAIMVV